MDGSILIVLLEVSNLTLLLFNVLSNLIVFTVESNLIVFCNGLIFTY